MKVSFSINIYEGNYKKVLLDGFLKQQLDIIDYDFCSKNITMTDIGDAQDAIEFIHSQFPDFMVYDTKLDCDKVLNNFNLKKEDINPTYYSIQHFNQIYHNDSDYHFNISSDCPLQIYDKNFIDDAIKIMEENDKIISAIPSWNQFFEDRKSESFAQIGNFYVVDGFADQMYLIKMSEFKRDIYHCNHPKSERYPPYGGNSFEKRIDSYMNTFDKYRITHSKSYYIHGG
jgi:hypothetical protein